MGSALLSVSYELALGFMMGLIALALPIAALGLPSGLGTARKASAEWHEAFALSLSPTPSRARARAPTQENAKWHDVFITHNPNLNWLSLARCFLFASRDFWFEVPLASAP